MSTFPVQWLVTVSGEKKHAQSFGAPSTHGTSCTQARNTKVRQATDAEDQDWSRDSKNTRKELQKPSPDKTCFQAALLQQSTEAWESHVVMVVVIPVFVVVQWCALWPEYGNAAWTLTTNRWVELTAKFLSFIWDGVVGVQPTKTWFPVCVHSSGESERTSGFCSKREIQAVVSKTTLPGQCSDKIISAISYSWTKLKKVWKFKSEKKEHWQETLGSECLRGRTLNTSHQVLILCLDRNNATDWSLWNGGAAVLIRGPFPLSRRKTWNAKPRTVVLA